LKFVFYIKIENNLKLILFSKEGFHAIQIFSKLLFKSSELLKVAFFKLNEMIIYTVDISKNNMQRQQFKNITQVYESVSKNLADDIP